MANILFSSALCQRRIVARIHRMREELGFRPSPELADVLVGLYCFVPELEAVFRALRSDATDIEGADCVAEVVEPDRPTGVSVRLTARSVAMNLSLSLRSPPSVFK